MSVVTDTILTFDWLEGNDTPLNAVNHALLKTGQVFVLTSDVDGASGGSKRHQMCIALAAFNHVLDEELISAVRAYAWNDPAEVRLFVHHEEDEVGFQELSWRGHEEQPIIGSLAIKAAYEKRQQQVKK